MRTGRGFERLVNFSDAVIAIAITLLVLPLVDIPGQAASGETFGQIFSDHRNEFGGFVLSFLVIWSLWDAHHQLLEHFRGYDQMLMRLHMVFLFTVVTLPFSTQLLSSSIGASAAPVYIGTLFVASLTLLGIAVRGRSTRELLQEDRAEVQQWLRDPLSWYKTIVMLIALVISLFWPAGGLFALLLLLLDALADKALLRFRSGVSSETHS